MESTQAHPHGARLGRDDDHRGVRPKRRGNSRDTVADAGAVLAYHYAMTAGHACVTVGHVAGALLMHDRNQADARRREREVRLVAPTSKQTFSSGT